MRWMFWRATFTGALILWLLAGMTLFAHVAHHRVDVVVARCQAVVDPGHHARRLTLSERLVAHLQTRRAAHEDAIGQWSTRTVTTGPENRRAPAAAPHVASKLSLANSGIANLAVLFDGARS